MHTNSGIHNKAAFNILTARTGDEQLFTPADVARLFYTTLVNHLTRTSKFIDSRRGAILATRSLFQSDRHRDQKVKEVQTAFDDVGIVDAGAGV
ncbi:Zn-dependent metalloprotease [Bradyrhizobium sp. USDA 223]